MKHPTKHPTKHPNKAPTPHLHPAPISTPGQDMHTIYGVSLFVPPRRNSIRASSFAALSSRLISGHPYPQLVGQMNNQVKDQVGVGVLSCGLCYYPQSRYYVRLIRGSGHFQCP